MSESKQARGWVAPLFEPGWRETLARCAGPLPLADAQGAQAPERLWLARLAGWRSDASSALVLIYAPKSNRRPPRFARFLEAERPRLWRPALIETNSVHLLGENEQVHHSLAIHKVSRLPSLWAALALLDETPEQEGGGAEAPWLAVPVAAVREREARDPTQAAQALHALQVALLRHEANGREQRVRSLARVALRLADGSYTQALRFAASPHLVPLLVPAARPQCRLGALPADLRTETLPAPDAGSPKPNEEIWLFKRLPSPPMERGGAYVRWGLTFSPLVLERTQALPAGEPLWQPWSHAPLALLEPAPRATAIAAEAREQPLAPPPLPPVVELTTHPSTEPLPQWGSVIPPSQPEAETRRKARTSTAHNATARTTATATDTQPPEPLAVEFRLVAQDARHHPPVAWLLDTQAFARLVEILRVRPQRQLAGLKLASLPEKEHHVLIRTEAERTGVEDFPGVGLASLPGASAVHVPLGYSVRPRIRPSRLGELLSLPSDGGLAIFVPGSLCPGATPHEAFPPTKEARGEPFEIWHLPAKAWHPLEELVRYTLSLGLSRKRPMPSLRLLDESLLATARTAATAFHRGLLAIKRPSGEAERPAIPAGASGLSQDTEQIPAATFRDDIPKEPDADSTLELEPLLLETPTPQVTDEVRKREVELEEAIAQRLHSPADPELAPLWLDLARLKAARGRIDEALYAWASAAWLHKPGAHPLTAPPLQRMVEKLSVSCKPAVSYHEQSADEIVEVLARTETWRVEHSVGLLLLLTKLEHAPQGHHRLLRMQQLLGTVGGSLPFKLRWLVASRLAELVGDEVALEREREDLLGELNLRGINRGNLLPMLRRLLRRARLAGSGASASEHTGEPEAPEPVSHVNVEVEAGPAGERATMDWPRPALEKWVAVLIRITTMNQHTSHGEAPVLMPFAEMLLTVSREAGKRLPFATLRAHIEQTRARMLKGILREHVSEFDPEHSESERQRRDALRQFGEGTAASESLTTGGTNTEAYAKLPAGLRERISTYLVLISLRWAQPAVRQFWREYLNAQSLSTILTMIAASPAAPLRWLTVLGKEFVFEELLPRMEQVLSGYKQHSEAEKVDFLLVLDELARMFERRDLPAYLRHDTALHATEGQEGRRRVQALFERLVKKVRFLKDKASADRYAPVLKRFTTLEADALASLAAPSEPRSEKDASWLEVRARLKVARAHHLCALGRRHEALELLQEVHWQWRATYATTPGRRSTLPSAVRNSLGWLLEELLATVPLTGNRGRGVAIVEECVQDARSAGDARYSAQVFSTAARSLAQLGAHDDTEKLLRTILATAREQLASKPSYLFEVVERVVSSALELLPAARLEEHILATLRQWLQSEATFDGTDGTFYRLKTVILIRFTEWSLSPSERVIPTLSALLTENVREELLGDDPLDLAIYWAEWFLKVHAYEWEESIMVYFETIDELVHQEQAGYGAALQYLQKLSDHFIGNVAVEDRALREFCRREESLVRDRVVRDRSAPYSGIRNG